jgi:hypothetical protein
LPVLNGTVMGLSQTGNIIDWNTGRVSFNLYNTCGAKPYKPPPTPSRSVRVFQVSQYAIAVDYDACIGNPESFFDSSPIAE